VSTTPWTHTGSGRKAANSSPPAPPRIIGGEIAVPDSPGLGIQLDRDRLLAAHELHQEKALGARDDTIAMRYLVLGWEFDSTCPRLVR
jgi:glucarate dehydratase